MCLVLDKHDELSEMKETPENNFDLEKILETKFTYKHAPARRSKHYEVSDKNYEKNR